MSKSVFEILQELRSRECESDRKSELLREAGGFHAVQFSRQQMAQQQARGMAQWRAACDRVTSMRSPWQC